MSGDANVTIVWKEDGTGTETRPGMSGPVYRLDAGLKAQIANNLGAILDRPQLFEADDVKAAFPRRGDFAPLTRVREEGFTFSHEAHIYVMMQTWLFYSSKFRAMGFPTNAPQETNEDDNATFLARLSAKRNWKRGCAVCSTDEIMGTACTCGHTEVVVLRPCGHALCKSPCFLKWYSTLKDVEKLSERTVSFPGPDGKMMTFVVGNSAAERTNCSTKGGFDCFLCRTPVIGSFDAQEAKVGTLYTEEEMTELVAKCRKGLLDKNYEC